MTTVKWRNMTWNVDFCITDWVFGANVRLGKESSSGFVGVGPILFGWWMTY